MSEHNMNRHHGRGELIQGGSLCIIDKNRRVRLTYTSCNFVAAIYTDWGSRW